MKEQKHIDRIFQERFKEFDVNPPAEVWDSIKAELRKEEKEDRKLIPIWWRVAGVAALFALLFTIGNSLFTSDSNNDLVIDPSVENPEQTTPDDPVNTIDTSNSKDGIADSKDNQVPTQQGATNKQIQLDSNTNTEAVAGANSKDKSKDKSANTTIYKFNTGINADNLNTDTAVTSTQTDNNPDATATSTKDTSTGTTTNNELINTDAVDALVQGTNTKDAVVGTSGTDNTSTDLENTAIDKTDSEEAETGKISLIEYLKDKEEQEDAVVEVETKALPDNRWSVAPQVAPVFYGSLADGSSIGSEFSDNTKSSDANLSYGVQVQYNVNDRFSIRSGVSKVNLSYNTNDIEFAVAPSTVSVSGSKFNTGGVTYAVADSGTLENTLAQGMPTDGLGPVTLDSFQGLLNQQLEYWEVPMEASYALVNNRFKLNVVGGISTLFLQDNTLKAISGSREADLGTLDNLNDLSFTTNVGLGFQYSISKRFAVNVEPMFKYQLNPYADSNVDFRPFYMGIYSGLSIKF